MSNRFALHGAEGSVRILELASRKNWAMAHRMAAGGTGRTPLNHPDPRRSDYVFDLRCRGVDIATLTEHHDGPFAGTRGGLRSKFERLAELQVAG
jgi:hypothetical protein